MTDEPNWTEQEYRAASIANRFLEYHTAHPDVYDYFDRFAMEVLDAGHIVYGANAIMERIRWEYDLADSNTREAFKISSEFIAFYARMWMENNPEHRGFFNTRPSIADDMFPPPEEWSFIAE